MHGVRFYSLPPQFTILFKGSKDESGGLEGPQGLHMHDGAAQDPVLASLPKPIAQGRKASLERPGPN